MATSSQIFGYVWLGFIILGTGIGILTGHLVSQSWYHCITNYDYCYPSDDISAGIIAGVVLIIIGGIWSLVSS
ncbi:4929_t:CDS:1, partial [Dentiscutata heterogama]